VTTTVLGKVLVGSIGTMIYTHMRKRFQFKNNKIN